LCDVRNRVAQMVALLTYLQELFGSNLGEDEFFWQVLMVFLSPARQLVGLYLKVGHDRIHIIPNSVFSDSVVK
jgi:hypothetical protein